MLQMLTFGVSTILAVAGMGFAVGGMIHGEFKPTAIGLVLIFGAGVFATLFLGTRWASRKSE